MKLEALELDRRVRDVRDPNRECSARLDDQFGGLEATVYEADLGRPLVGPPGSRDP